MPRSKKIDVSKQLVLWIVANSGGVGKTTLAVHVGYDLAKQGLDVLILDLDTNGSLARFCGLESDKRPDETAAAIFDRNFKGEYPTFSPLWAKTKGKFDLCLGGDVMLSVALDLPSRTGREYILKRALNKYPVPYDLIIIDSPASLDVLSYTALSAASHVLIPLPMSVKLAGIDPLLQWLRNESDALDLNPPPQVLGGVPMRVGKNADQRAFYSEIGDVLNAQNIYCFPGIRYSAEFENASNRGMAPLFEYRPKNPACKDFSPITQSVLKCY